MPGHFGDGASVRPYNRVALRLLHRLKKENGEDQLRTKLEQCIGSLSLLLAS